MSDTVSTHKPADGQGGEPQQSFLATRADLIRTAAWFWAAAAAVAYILQFYGQTRVGLTDGKRLPLGVDFLNYWGSSMLAWQGRTGEIYDWHRYYNYLESIAGAPIGPFHYSYPPVLLVMTMPFIVFPYVPGLAIWLLSSWYVFYRLLKLAAPNGAFLLAVATPAVFLNAAGGQNGFWTAAFLGGGLCLLQRAPVTAGIMFGMLIYKPHLAILIPVTLAAGRQWRAFFSASATVIVLLAVSVLVFGTDIWAAYFERVTVLRIWILEDGHGVWHRMMSVFVAARRLGLDVTSAYMVQVAIGLAAAAIVAVAWYRDAPAPIRYSLAVLGTFLATPYLQDYDLVAGAFVVAWLFVTPGRFPQTPAMIVSALILLAPIFAAPIGKMTGVVTGPLFLIPAFLMVAGMAPDVFRRPKP
jgi:arabinofuranan 3-O-arabinosyltransferase